MSILLGSGPGRVAISLTASGNNYDVYTNRGPSYSPGKSDITVNIPAPTTIGSSSTGAYALLVPSAFNPTDTVTIVNNGLIQGAGGAGGYGGPRPPYTPANFGTYSSGGAGAAGGSALYVNRPVTVTNNGTIAGGGGGGGGGLGYRTPAGTVKSPATSYAYAGGGGGGGAGTVGGAGGPGATNTFNGAAGTSSAGGSGGPPEGPGAGGGGPGGGRGAAGTSTPVSGGAAGNYIVGNPFVTWPATGTRQGGVA